MASRFRHEDRAAVPQGWKVRTIKEGKHRLRMAFPPGRKMENGRLVSILHPAGENPCTLRSTNPAELMVMGANPPRRRNGWKYEVVAVGRYGGEKRKAFDSKEEAKAFAKKEVSLADYFKPHIQKIRVNPAELMIMAANPRVEVVHGDNPPVEEIAEAFSGTEVEFLDVYNEPHMPRGRYAYLGELLSLHIKPAKGGQVQRISFSAGKDAPIVVTDSTAKQIYFVNGNQDISGALNTFGAQSRIGDDLLELGVGRRIDYKARKEHVAEPDEDKWKHDHGEENGSFPTVLFDTRNKKLLYEGGDYRIEGPWIRN